MGLQLIKLKEGRKRFIKTPPLPDFSHWQQHLAELKSQLAKNSHFQIVGNKIYFEMAMKGSAPRMMLPVIGPPMPFLENNLVLSDWENHEIWVHKLLGIDIFSADLDHILKAKEALKSPLEASFRHHGGELADIFHIVFNDNKIELHFFSQKDYIQKQF